MKDKLYRYLVLALTLCVVLLLAVNALLLRRWYLLRQNIPSAPAGVSAVSAAEEPLTAEAAPAETAPVAAAPASVTPEPGSIPCTIRVANTACWSAEDRVLQVASLSKGEEVYLTAEKDGICSVTLADGSTVWINSWALVALDDAVQAEREAAQLALNTAYEGYTPYTGVNPYFSVTAATVNCRSGPSTAYAVVYALPYGSFVEVLGSTNGFSLCKPVEGGYFWCSSSYLSGETEFLEVAGAVDLREYLPEAQFELRFASVNNVAGRSLYPAVPLLETDTAAHLLRAYNQFLADGYILKIYDAYRPLSAQQTLYSIVKDYKYIANPWQGYSWHQYGRAVDISLVDAATGEELEMPTDMHSFTALAQRVCSKQWTDTARDNVAYMTKVMQQAGFNTISTEWWHFQYEYGEARMDPELNLSALIPVSGDGA